MYEINEFKKVAPKIRTQDRKTEKLYTRELTGYLRRPFPDIKLEQSLGKGTNVGNPRSGSNSTSNIFGTGRTRAPGCKRTKKEINASIIYRVTPIMSQRSLFNHASGNIFCEAIRGPKWELTRAFFLCMMPLVQTIKPWVFNHSHPEKGGRK